MLTQKLIMLLAIDVGNTRIKCALFEDDTIIELFVFDKNEFKNNFKIIIENNNKIKYLVISSVGNLTKLDFMEIRSDLEINFITNLSDFPFKNLYKTPKTVGIDRLVLSSGAVLQFPNKNRLVIDAGTCVTYDFVSQENQYLGGAISPGINLRYLALHNYTAKLPLLDKEIPADLIGNTTDQSIHSGVINGIVNEIDGFIDQYRERYSNFIIILTGGDAVFLANRLKNTIFANPNFLLESLNQTFQYINQK